MYQVEKNIPIRKKESENYPWDNLNINDSFLIPTESLSKNTRQNLHSTAKNRGIVIATHKTDRGLRVWRKA